MTLPPCRVFASPQVLRFGSIENALNPTTEPLGSFWNPRPKRRQHPKHVVGRDLVDRLVPKAGGVLFEGHFPLVGVLLVARARFHRPNVPIGKVAEARNLLLQEHRSGIAVVGQGLAKDFRPEAVDADSADSVSASDPIRIDPRFVQKTAEIRQFQWLE